MKKSKFFNRKFALISVLMMLMMGITAVVYAANTPAWWDNPGGATSWNQSGPFYGNAANSSGSDQTLYIDNDLVTCNVGDHIEVWAQIAWINTGSPDVTLISGGSDSALQFTTNASGCPANVSIALPTPPTFPFNLAALTEEGAFVPTGNSVPSNLAFTDGTERSHTFTDNTATCARPRTSFNIPDGGGLEYRIEVQSVCVSPTAVSLQTFSTNSTSALPAAGLIAFALLAIIGTGVALTRRQQA